MEIWNGFKRSDLERMIVAMAEDLPSEDIRKLDQLLVDARQHTPLPSKTVSARCTFKRQLRRGLAFPVTVNCRSADYALTGALEGWRGTSISGEISNLQIDGFEIRDRQKLDQTASSQPAQKSFTVRLNGNHMRLPDGRRISRVVITPDRTDQAEPVAGTARLTVDNDFQIVREALSRMTGSDFASHPFHAPNLLSRLFLNLGAAHTVWCCDTAQPMPAVRLDEALTPTEVVDAIKSQSPEHLFGRYCSRCHRTQNTVPPNFLSGSKSAVAHNIDHCAPRMDYRLSMWDVPIDERTRSPMPPESALPSLGLSNTTWRNSQELATLRAYVKSLLATERDTTIDYESLRNCLPDAEQASTAN